MLRCLLATAFLLTSVVVAFSQSPDPAPDAVEPGDVVRLTIWREPDLSGEFPVQEDMRVVLPRLGPWDVTGKGPTEIREDLIEDLSEVLRNPSIQVIVLRRINIVGEVRTPGIYPVDPTLTLSEAISLAGGPTPTANRQKVVLIRDGREIEIELDQPYSVVDLALQSGDQLYVPQRGWFVRNLSLIASVTSLLTGLTLLITRL